MESFKNQVVQFSKSENALKKYSQDLHCNLRREKDIWDFIVPPLLLQGNYLPLERLLYMLGYKTQLHIRNQDRTCCKPLILKISEATSPADFKELAVVRGTWSGGQVYLSAEPQYAADNYRGTKKRSLLFHPLKLNAQCFC